LEQLYQNIDSNKEHVKSRLEELIKATIIKAPTDISVFRGSRAVLKVIYHGCPEPTVNWLQVVGLFFLLLIFKQILLLFCFLNKFY